MSGPRNLIGQTLGGRYRINEILGKGGMSAVYKSYDPNLRRIVAVKVIHSHLADDPKFINRFQEEAAAVAMLRHPNIVQVFDFNHDDDLYYMVQEYISGETLQERLRRLNLAGERMPIEDAVRLTIQVCYAAEYAHQRGMIHRDIKPANIMIDSNGQGILMDFGIVKILGGERHTSTGVVVGTALYMSPETIHGRQPDPRSDIYSLGVTFFEMINGRPPFEADSAMAVMMMHVNSPIPALPHLRPDAPHPLVDVIEKALAKQADNRFTSMGEMAAALKAFARQQQTGAGSAATLNLAIDRPPAGPQPAAPSPAQPPTLVETSHPDAPTGTSARETPSSADRPPAGFPAATVSENPSGVSTPPRVRPERATIIESPPRARPIAPAQPPPPDDPIATRIELPPTPSRPEPRISQIPATSSPQPTASSIPGQAPVSTVPKAKPIRIGLLAGLALVGLIILGVFGAFALGAFNRTADTTPTTLATSVSTTAPSSSTSAAAVVVATATTVAPTATNTPEPTSTAPAAPTLPAVSTPAIPPGVPFARINGVSLDSLGRYDVDYETFEFTEKLEDLHLVFFFNTQTTDQGYMYGGPRPFSKFTAAERPKNAHSLCIAVANRDHSVRLNSGNCTLLPDVVAITSGVDTACLSGPGVDFPVAATLPAGAHALALGISPDESWWNVVNPEDLVGNCWLPIASTQADGDVSALPLAEFTPAASQSVEITSITLDDQARYVIAYTTTGFTEQLPGTHIHFFFNTFSPDQVGPLGGGNRLMYGGPSPFTGFRAVTRPPQATQICALVATPDHTVVPNSGNCFNLPDAQ